MYKQILVATDDSKLSERAVYSAIGLVQSIGAKLFIVHVVPLYPVSYYEGGLVVSNADMKRTEKLWLDKGREVVKRIESIAAEREIKATGIVLQSSEVSECIIAAAKEHHCDLIVMASHGRKGLTRILLGSQTMDVLTHSEIPVLVVR